MFVELRPNIFLSDLEGLTTKVIEENAINRLVVVADDLTSAPNFEVTTFYCPLKSNRMNPTHLKDLACHCPKYMIQNGDKVCIVSKTGKGRGAYVVARMICELEGKSIYDVFLEMQTKIEGFDIGQAYF